VVYLSVCLSVCLQITFKNPSKTTELIKISILEADLGVPKESCITWGPDLVKGRGNSRGLSGR